MKTYKDLNKFEQNLFNKIEQIFIHSGYTRTQFTKVLGVLINKHKYSSKKDEGGK